MRDISEDFEIISRHGNYGGWLKTLSAFVTDVPPGPPDTVTIKVREKSTGNVRSVTARDEPTALEYLRNGIFD